MGDNLAGASDSNLALFDLLKQPLPFLLSLFNQRNGRIEICQPWRRPYWQTNARCGN
jgi:hypothetical protein